MTRPPSFKTPRLLIRPLEYSDAKALYEIAKDPSIGPLAGWLPHENSDATKRYIERSLHKEKLKRSMTFAVIHQSDDILIGTLELYNIIPQFKADIGMICAKTYQNQGYLSEASLALLVYCFETLKLSRLTYGHFLDNEASKRVREKLNFTHEGILRNYYKRYDGKIVDYVIAGFTDADYLYYYETIFKPYKRHLTVLKKVKK